MTPEDLKNILTARSGMAEIVPNKGEEQIILNTKGIVSSPGIVEYDGSDPERNPPKLPYGHESLPVQEDGGLYNARTHPLGIDPSGKQCILKSYVVSSPASLPKGARGLLRCIFELTIDKIDGVPIGKSIPTSEIPYNHPGQTVPKSSELSYESWKSIDIQFGYNNSTELNTAWTQWIKSFTPGEISERNMMMILLVAYKDDPTNREVLDGILYCIYPSQEMTFKGKFTRSSLTRQIAMCFNETKSEST